MNEIGYFIDVERFTQWLHNNTEYVGDETLSIIRSSICKYWLRYEKFPTDKYIEDVNKLLKPNEEKFEKINIADLLICVNNTIDINKGQKLQTITSTGKKVMVLLLLGRILDGKNKDGYFTVTQKKNFDLWNYLTSFNNSPNKIKMFYYYPGRTVSLEQLKSIGRSYKNGIKATAIPDGIVELARAGLVSCVDAQRELYKLDFNGCKKFLEENK